MPTESAGILLYRFRGGELELLLAHPGGPFWRGRDQGAWMIAKGEIEAGEDSETAARREFREELGVEANGALAPLGTIRQKGGKIVHAFALEGDFDIDALQSNTFDIEWPPRSGKHQSFPEIDRVAWMNVPLARTMILESQQPLIDRLEAVLASKR